MPRTSLVLPAVALSAASLLPCQVWAEVGDAGALPNNAQQTTGAGNLAQITGTIGAQDVDMYLIQIFDTMTFQASTIGGASFDTQLWLFDQDGNGVTHNDDAQGGIQSRITGQFVLAPGRYYLAIARQQASAYSASFAMWAFPGNNTIERRPDGDGRGDPLYQWGQANVFAGGAYTISLTGAAFAPDQVQLPGNHHLSESASQTSGSTDYFRSAPTGHFQVLYGPNWFLNAGINGPRTITRIQFRGEDTEQNRGGQIYQNLAVTVGSTSLTPSTMSTTFATNLNPAFTSVGPTAFIANKTIKRALGLCPNNYVVDIDLNALGIPWTHDPTGSRPNFVLDFTWSSAGPGPNGTNTIALQDTTGGPLVVHGRGLTGNDNISVTGVLRDPLVTLLDVQGGGGDDVLIPARVQSIGSSCGGSASAWYQYFPNTEAFDLAGDPVNRGITFTPDQYPAPNYYTVTFHGNAVDLTQLNAVPSTTVEDATVTHPLPQAFQYPGGTTSVIRVDDNGHIRLTSATLSAPWDPSLAKFLGTSGEGPMIAPFWADFSCGRNVLTHPSSGLHVRTVGNDVWITWYNVGRFNTAPTPGGQSVNTMQCLMKTGTGVIEFRYGAMDQITGSTVGGNTNGITGFSRGSIGTVASVDPGSTDISRELPRRTYPEGPSNNLKQIALQSYGIGPPHMPGRMFDTAQIHWSATNIPPGTVFGLQLIDIAATRPGVQVPGIIEPGCLLSTGLAPFIHEAFVLPGSTVTGTVPFVVPPGFDNAKITAQFAAVSFPPSGINLKLSNALLHTLGKR